MPFEDSPFFIQDFEQVAEILFQYNSTEKKILSIFQKADLHGLYAYWYEEFLKRSKYDKRFKKLQRKM